MDKKVAIQIQHDQNYKELLKIASESGFKYVSMGFGSSRVFLDDNYQKEIDVIASELEKTT